MKAEYNRLFDKITSDLSDRELLDMALRKAENMEKTTKKSVRKPIIAACAAAAVLAAGTIGVGAALDWDFNSLFGTRIVAETEQLGQELLGEAQNAVKPFVKEVREDFFDKLSRRLCLRLSTCFRYPDTQP